MIIREYQPSDCKEVAELFYNTIHIVNARDYTKEQLDVWATGRVDLENWNQSFQEHYSIVVLDVLPNRLLAYNLFFTKQCYQEDQIVYNKAFTVIIYKLGKTLVQWLEQWRQQ